MTSYPCNSCGRMSPVYGTCRFCMITTKPNPPSRFRAKATEMASRPYNGPQELVNAWVLALEEAVAEEREACAQIAHSFQPLSNDPRFVSDYHRAVWNTCVNIETQIRKDRP